MEGIMGDNCIINTNCNLGTGRINYTSDTTYCSLNGCNVTYNSSINVSNISIPPNLTTVFMFLNAYSRII
jgi:hypothetical protein